MDAIKVFGATTAVVAGREVSGPSLGGVKPRQVLEVLALAEGAPVSKDRLVDLLWSERAPASAIATLESYVCVLRRAISPGEGGRTSLVQTTSAGYRLDTTRVTVDLTECRTLLSLATSSSPQQSVELVRAALPLCAQPLLAAETGAAWADRERDAFTHLLAGACAAAARAALTLDDTGTALELSSRAGDLDPLDEGAVHTRMAALAAAGRRAESLRCFLDLRRRLVTDLGVEPGRATRDLYVRLLTDPAEVPDGRSPSRGEVTGLLELLRDTLVRVPGLDATSLDHALSGLASQALARL